MFQDEEVRLKSGPIAQEEKLEILNRLGEIAQEKYNENVILGGISKGYDLRKLQDSLQFIPNLYVFENVYYLQGKDQHWTDIAYYFEHGTGLFNVTRAGQYRAGYIKPVIKEYMSFIAKDGKFVNTKKVKGVHPIFAMQKAIKYVEFHRRSLQRHIRVEINYG